MSLKTSWEALKRSQIATKNMAYATGQIDGAMLAKCLAVYCGHHPDDAFTEQEKGLGCDIVDLIRKAESMRSEVHAAYNRRDPRDRKTSRIIELSSNRLVAFVHRWEQHKDQVNEVLRRAPKDRVGFLIAAAEEAFEEASNFSRLDPASRKQKRRRKALTHLKKARDAAKSPEDSCADLFPKLSALAEEAERADAKAACRAYNQL